MIYICNCGELIEIRTVIALQGLPIYLHNPCAMPLSQEVYNLSKIPQILKQNVDKIHEWKC